MRCCLAIVVVVVIAGCVPGEHGAVDAVRLAPFAPLPTGAAPDAVSFDGVPDGVDVFDEGVVGVVGGHSGEFFVDVDADVRGFVVVVGAFADAVVVVDRLTAPDGTAFVDAVADDASAQALRLSRGFAGPFLSPHRFAAQVGGGAFAVPATPDVPLTPGTWRLRLRASDDRPLRLAVLVDRRPAGTRARLDLALHRASDIDVNAVAEVLIDAFGAVGVDVVAVPVDAPGADDVVVDLDGDTCDGGDLPALFRSLTPTPGAVDVVFVDRLVCGDVDVSGVAGGVPGDVFVEGGVHGGVAVARGAEDEGVVVAHEVGHLLGLFHTVEAASGADPLIFDVVDDTDDDFAAANLMRFDPAGSRALTDGQGFVLRNNPWLAPVE